MSPELSKINSSIHLHLQLKRCLIYYENISFNHDYDTSDTG